MKQPFFVEQIKAAKRFCWNMYSNKPWFCGCYYRCDEEDSGIVVGVDVLYDPENKERFTFAQEHEGVPLYIVPWDPEKHGERYDKEKHGA